MQKITPEEVPLRCNRCGGEPDVFDSHAGFYIRCANPACIADTEVYPTYAQAVASWNADFGRKPPGPVLEDALGAGDEVF